MAIIGKIREKSGWAIGIVAIGLILFILGGDLLSPTSVLRGNSERVVGKIAGEKIAVDKFEAELNELKYTYYLNTNKMPGETEMQQFLPQAWNQLLFKVAYQKQFDQLGLEVGKEEQIDMVQGKNIHPAILQSFRNPTTGQFDRNVVVNYLQNMSRMDQKQRTIWLNFEKNLAPDRLRTKYEALIKKTGYVTKAEAKREFLSQNRKASAKYVFIPYTLIQDSEVQLNDDLLAEYAEKNKKKFSVEPSANLEYVSFSIIASREDSANFFKELTETISEFKKSDDDSMFVALNADNPTPPTWMNPGELPTLLQKVSSFKKDSVYGPFVEAGSYKVYKVVDSKSDSLAAARASHILFRWDSESAEDKKKAMEKCKEVLAKIKKGENFEDMARQFGTDGTSSQGGDLGWFGQGRMVKQFEEAVFASNSKGLLPNPIETQFGYHIIKVTETKTNKKYYIAGIDKTIVPGDATRDSVYKKAETLALQSRDADGLEVYLKSNPGLAKLAAPNITASTPYVNNLTDPKELIRWTFTDAKEGALSPVFEISNQFVVAVLKNIYPKGTVNLEANKYQIYYTMANEKKADKILEKIGAEANNLDQAASKMGNGITVTTANDISFSSGTLGTNGFEPEAVGAIFGLKSGQTSGPIKGNMGVILVQPTAITAPSEIADYNMFKNQLLNMNNSRNEYFIGEAVKDNADITDTRYKFY